MLNCSYSVKPPADPTRVRAMREADAAAWTDFIARRPEANLYHTLLWRDVITEVFGHQPIYLLAKRGADVCGVLPMYLIHRSRLATRKLGSKLISLPYDIGAGGVHAVDDAAERAMVESAISLARERRVGYLELRYGSDHPRLLRLGMQRSEPVLISEMELDGEAAVWARVREDHRKAIRKAQNRGVTIHEATSLADFREFYLIYVRVFRDFGTPPYGGDYFPALWRLLHPTGAVRLRLAYVGRRCMGGLLLFCWGQNMVSKIAACLPEGVPLRTYAALYWHAIQLGLKLGYRRLSWGTSSRDQAGLIEFKERWGAQSRPAVLYDLPVRGRVPNIEGFYDSAHWTRRLWRRLPLGATRVGGAALNRWYC